jgi:hypothetical protein
MSPDNSDVEGIDAAYASACNLHERIHDCIFDLRKGWANEHEAGILINRATELAQEPDPLHSLLSRYAISKSAEEEPVLQPKPSGFWGGQRQNGDPPPPPSDPTRITTGRHLKRLGPKQLEGTTIEEVPAKFFHETADTHGGKVKHGKKPGSYVTRGGRRIRKK